ncbi:MAG TPA: polyketide synthase dehydratase domain-containing protein, partial [Thermoanaerobaculia bacterium]
GVAGVLKLLLALKHRQIPPSLHYDKSNPAIDLESGPFYVNTELQEWKVAEGETRRAAMSAFGFSGTNAHLVIEETPAVPRAAVQAPAYLVVLSARTAEQLKQQAQNLAAQVKQTPDISMNDLGFTLFTGRMHHARRLACVARSQQELVQILEQWIATGAASQVFSAEVQESKVRAQGALKKFGNYCIEECRVAATADAYVENLVAVADLYVQGYALEYETLFPAGSRRIPLPKYPFARERYWVNGGNAGAPQSATASAARLHPLLHINTSTLTQQSYGATVTGAEAFLEEYRPGSNGHGMQKIMAPAAYLEMARAAVALAAPAPAGSSIELEEIVWGEPMIVTGQQQLTIALVPTDDARIAYEIYSGHGAPAVVHGQGKAAYSDEAAPAALDLERLQAQMRHGSTNADAVYAGFVINSAQSGSAHRPITALHRGEGQLLARLSLPQSAATEEASGYFLHPVLMSGALQAALQLVAGDAHSATTRLPHRLDRLRILSSCTAEMFAWVRHSPAHASNGQPAKVDVDLVDLQGRVCAELRGLSFESAEHPHAASLEPEWLFSMDASSIPGDVAAHVVSMSPEEKVATLLRQEAALQLEVRPADVATDRSYFDLGLSSLAIATLVQNANRLLGEELSPSVLFEYSDIDSLAGYVAAAYPDKIDALLVMKRAPRPHSTAVPHSDPPRLTPLPRRQFNAGRNVRLEPTQALAPANGGAGHAGANGDGIVADVLWQESSLADSYEKLTF